MFIIFLWQPFQMQSWDYKWSRFRDTRDSTMHATRHSVDIWTYFFPEYKKEQLPVNATRLQINLKILACWWIISYWPMLVRFTPTQNALILCKLVSVDHSNWWRYGTCCTQQMVGRERLFLGDFVAVQDQGELWYAIQPYVEIFHCDTPGIVKLKKKWGLRSPACRM